jgi:UDP-glucose 4-epimerase
MRKKIVVTGGLGFIGSHTAVELITAGYDAVIVDDLSNSQLFILDNIEKITGVKPAFYQVNVSEPEALKNVFVKEKNIAAVIHFAASKAVGESVVKPLKYFHNNLLSLITLLECMEEFEVKPVVFSSSATVYGQADDLPVTESTPFKKALSAYGSTKQMGEEILEKVAATGNIQAIVLRYFNPVGAHESALLGELPIGTPNNLMPFVTQAAAGARKELVVFGNDYATPDGTCVRDYVHVVDLAKAHVMSCNRLLDDDVAKDNFEAYNTGTGQGISVLQIITAFEQCNELKLNYTIGKRREGDAPAIYANAELAENVLGWKAKLGLNDMVTSAWQWQQQINKQRLWE